MLLNLLLFNFFSFSCYQAFSPLSGFNKHTHTLLEVKWVGHFPLCHFKEMASELQKWGVLSLTSCNNFVPA